MRPWLSKPLPAGKQKKQNKPCCQVYRDGACTVLILKADRIRTLQQERHSFGSGVFALGVIMTNKASDIHVNIKVDNMQEAYDLIQSIKKGLNEIADDICKLYELVKGREI